MSMKQKRIYLKGMVIYEIKKNQKLFCSICLHDNALRLLRQGSRYS